MMRRKVLFTYTLQSEDVACKVPTYLSNLNGITFSCRRLIYGFQPELYFCVFHIGKKDDSLLDKHWKKESNTFLSPFHTYNEVEKGYPHQKLSKTSFVKEEAKRIAQQVEKRIGRLLS